MKHFAFIGVLVALGLAAGVWVLDLGFLRVPDTTVRPNDIDDPALNRPDTDNEAWHEPADWTVLSPALESLRRPIEPPTPPPSVEDEPDDTPSESTKPPPRRLPDLQWKYKGYISAGDSRRALVELDDGTERFLAPGVAIVDPANPGGRGMWITEIRADGIVVQRDDVQSEDVALYDAGADPTDSGRSSDFTNPRDPRNMRRNER
ncbi:MAG: hypothetical protein RIB32_03595 [Phycisphaerales bacterium]